MENPETWYTYFHFVKVVKSGASHREIRIIICLGHLRPSKGLTASMT